MDTKQKNNSGFTLIELIIAIAVLAFLMTAVSSMMGSSVFANKKAQNDLTVQTSAQDVYNKLTDTVMQAKKVYVFGYTFSGTPNFSKSGDAATGTPGLNVYAVFDKRKYLQKDATGAYDEARTIDKNKEAIVNDLANYGYTVSSANIKFFSELAPTDELYVQKLIVVSAVPIDLSAVPSYSGGASGGYTITNAFTHVPDVIKTNVSVTGDTVYSEYDSLVTVFTFDEDNLYLEQKYAYMTSLNDYVTDWSDANAVKRRLYSDSIGYNTTDGDTISGCVAKIDYNNGAIGFDLFFNKKNMTYTSLGMVNVRNSYILKAKN
ncbi:MAG: prepilin-type N-terminal cleavage/methylation domain-containing protein [Clostridium sp.]|nr:prepilin-type N-terminal cleavage/methylation domain-containing protein [Clostridium sp.]MCM1400231.1 prepilin-type N-terminal cleavage/methylation domain-containing protein [Clostridium sp.]MCM1460316.1 prepilin-type N-terminal cleavage/methylation domain-containing protein [Bacteroides sp.]